jgi:hypothetical protein
LFAQLGDFVVLKAELVTCCIRAYALNRSGLHTHGSTATFF